MECLWHVIAAGKDAGNKITSRQISCSAASHYVEQRPVCILAGIVRKQPCVLNDYPRQSLRREPACEAIFNQFVIFFSKLSFQPFNIRLINIELSVFFKTLIHCLLDASQRCLKRVPFSFFHAVALFYLFTAYF